MNPRSFFAQRPLVCLAAAYAPGILLARLWAGFNPWLPLLGLAAALAAAFLYRPASLARAAALCLFFCLLGTLLGGLAAHPDRPEEGTYRVSGIVTGTSRRSEDGRRIKALLRDVRLTPESGTERRLNKAYWTYYTEAEAALPLDGQRAEFSGQVYHPGGRVNPYGFDFRDYLLQRGISVGLSDAAELALEPPGQSGPASPWLRLREALSTRLDLLFGNQAPLFKALLIGVRDDLDEGIQNDFRVAGIAHVLAVSGLHVGFLVLSLTALLRLLRLSPRAVLALTALFLLFYCRLLDFTPSVVRAALLSLLLLTGRLLRRRADPLSSLAAAFLLILLVRPMDLFNLGFQLSFLAVLGIITLGDRFTSLLANWRFFKRLPAWLKAVCEAYAITLAASLMTLVPLANAFHSLSLAGLLISPLAIALVGLLLQAGLLALLLSYPLMALGGLLVLPLRGFAEAYLRFVRLSAGMPNAAVRLGGFSAIQALGLYALLWLGSRYTRVRKWPRLALAGALAMAVAVVPLVSRDASLRYIQLESGYADSALILDGDTTFVIDTGEHGGDLAAFLLREGRQVDALLLTHLHSDHAGGLRQLLEQGVTINEILLPYGALEAGSLDGAEAPLDEARRMGIPIRALGRGDTLASARVSGQVLWPYHQALYPGLAANEGSLVIYWELDGASLLTTGDLSKDYAGYVLRPAQVMKLPHHGSGADNSGELLSLVSPRLALLTASTRQPERHQAARETLEGRGARVLVTGQTGAITLTFARGEILAHTYLPGKD